LGPDEEAVLEFHSVKSIVTYTYTEGTELLMQLHRSRRNMPAGEYIDLIKICKASQEWTGNMAQIVKINIVETL